jgi:hypothetical protein
VECRELQHEYEIIGRAEQVSLPILDQKLAHARIDSGARTSAIWGQATIVDNRLHVKFFGEEKEYIFESYGRQAVASSNGHIDQRYTIKMPVVIGGKKINATFTIANRSMQVYPILIGRNVLRGKFVVDVKRGTILKASEAARIKYLNNLIDEN